MIFKKSKNTYFATPKDNPKDKITLEVGDSKQPDFKPQQKIMRWDNEVNVSLRLVHDEVSPTVSKSGEKITWEGKKVKAEIYPLTEDEGGQEFEITLKEKPKSNVVQFTLVDKGVEYFYQPPLTEEIKVGDEEGRIVKVTETDAFDKDGHILYHRPENVVGSYAVYALENKINYVGGKEYKCGQVGMIYRPRIEDANGDWVWGDLNIKDGILSVTITQEFLDKAVYPVRHAAGLTFGYTSVGGSSAYHYTPQFRASKYSSPSDINTVDSISIYNGYTNNINIKALLIDTSLYLVTNGIGQGTATGTSAGWKTSSFSTPPSLTPSTYYWLTAIASASTFEYRFSSVAENIGFYDSSGNSGYNSPSNPSGDNIYYYKHQLSIYATYTAGGGLDNTETPSSQTSTFSLPTPTVTAVKNESVSPTVQSSTFSLPTPSVSTTTDVTVANLLIETSISLPTISVSTTSNVNITPSPLSLSATNPNPTIVDQKNVSISTEVQTSSFTLNSPTVTTSSNVSVSAGVQSLSSSQPIPDISTEVNISVSANALEVNSSQPTVTVSTTSNVSISLPTQSLAFSAQDPTITDQKNVSTEVGVLTNTFNPCDISLSLGTNLNLDTQTSSFTTNSPTVTAVKNVDVSLDPLSATFSQNSPSISSSSEVDVGVNSQNLLFSLPDISVIAIKNVNLTLGESLTLTQKDIIVTGDSNITANSQSLLLSLPIPTVETTVGAIYKKNSNFYQSIEDDLSIMLGQPRYPTWNIKGRPEGQIGLYGYNIDTNKIEFYNGTTWNEINLNPI